MYLYSMVVTPNNSLFYLFLCIFQFLTRSQNNRNIFVLKCIYEKNMSAFQVGPIVQIVTFLVSKFYQIV